MAQARCRQQPPRPSAIAEHATGMIASRAVPGADRLDGAVTFKPAAGGAPAAAAAMADDRLLGRELRHARTPSATGCGCRRRTASTSPSMTVVLSVIVSVLAGYGFSRFRFPFKDLLFIVILSTIMIPFQSILTPIFLVLTRLGLHNTLTGLVCVYVTLQLPFSIFMMRNAFDAVPREIEEAARMDGANNVAMLLVMLPLVWPGIVTIALFAFLGAWNEFLAALVLMTDQSKFTLPVMMTPLQSGRFGAIDWGAVQAGVTVMMVPCLILFLLLQRFYIRGLMAGAVK